MNPLSRIAAMLRGGMAARGQARPEKRLRVANLTRQTVLASSMKVADTAARRNKGLLGRERLSPGEGLWIRPCESVHTFWMRFSIDLVYVDRKNRIRKLVSELRPWRLSGCLWAHSVLELPSGTILNTETQMGDTLEFSEASEAPLTGDSSA
jgi:uncharacterized membrane protein (UPF0127 family)